MLLKSMVFTLTLAALSGLSACKSDGPEEVSEFKTNDGDLVTTLFLSKDEEQTVYLKMLAVELSSGVQVPKDQLHSVSGLVECHKDGVLETCSLRVRLPGEQLSATQPLTQALNERLWKFARDARPEFVEEKLVVSDLVCDYIGKKSPPFQVEDVKCIVTLPRTVDEAMFADLMAEELTEALRGTAPFGEKAMTLNGSVTCHWATGSNRPACVVRAIVGGVLTEKVTEVSKQHAPTVAKRLKRAVMDAAKLTTNADGKKIADEPRTVAASLTCIVDNSDYAEGGERTYLCKSKL